MKKSLFYILSFTWGLPMTLVGYLAALIVLMVGGKPKGKYGYCNVFQIGNNWGGASLGLVIITDKDMDSKLLKHEHGHAIQNCWFGPLFPFIVGIPSMLRYQWMDISTRMGATDLPSYDSVWFEGQATRVGTEFIEKYFE